MEPSPYVNANNNRVGLASTESGADQGNVSRQINDGAEANPGGEAVYRVGTLSYTRSQLIFVFLMLLGGDFAFTFFEQVFRGVIPLLAKDLHASNTLIGVMTGSIAGVMNLFFLPNISMKSDRHRGPLGRRIPYLLLSTPCTVGSLLLVGFAPEIGRWLHERTFLGEMASETSLILGLLCLFAASYHLWNMVLNNVYIWLIRDVVPGEFIGQFLAWFRVVATLASFGFLWWVFPHVLDYRRTVFVGVGGVYLFIFMLMCWQVREGDYPPPPVENDAPGIVRTFARYFRECLWVPLYRNYFIVYVLMSVATSSVGPFTTLFARDRLHLDLGDIGRIGAWGTLAGAFLFVPLGWISDKIKPIWVVTGGLIGIILVTLAAYFFVHDRTAWWIYALVSALPSCAWGLGNSAFSMALFPQEEFGQFSAGLNVFGMGGLIVGNYLMGQFMDLVHSQYEFAFLWTAVITTVALIPMSWVLRGWRQHGGSHHYKPPLPPIGTVVHGEAV